MTYLVVGLFGLVAGWLVPDARAGGRRRRAVARLIRRRRSTRTTECCCSVDPTRRAATLELELAEPSALPAYSAPPSSANRSCPEAVRPSRLLELLQRRLGFRAELAVDRAGVEARVVQRLLRLAHLASCPATARWFARRRWPGMPVGDCVALIRRLGGSGRRRVGRRHGACALLTANAAMTSCLSFMW